MNPADLSWPEDPGYKLIRRPRKTPREELEQELAIAQALLAYAGARRERYGRLPGRDPGIVKRLNVEVTQAQADCDAARQALIDAGEAP